MPPLMRAADIVIDRILNRHATFFRPCDEERETRKSYNICNDQRKRQQAKRTKKKKKKKRCCGASFKKNKTKQTKKNKKKKTERAALKVTKN